MVGSAREGENAEKMKKPWGIWGGITAFLVFLGTKVKMLLPLLKLGQAGGTIWSMLLMAWSYTLFYPWEVSLGFVLLILVHEMGHVWAARIKGVPVSAPAFIPFVGALINLRKEPQDAKTEAFIAFGGPILGSVGAFGVFLAAIVVDYPPLYLIAWVGFLLNLINLVPMHPLDGGRIVTAISRWLWLIGLIVGLFLILFFRSFLFLLIWILFAWQLYLAVFGKNKRKEIKLTKQLRFERSPFEEGGMISPGSDHERPLDFYQYAAIEDRSERLAVQYPGLGFLGEIPFQEGEVTQVKMKGLKREKDGAYLIPMEIRFIPISLNLLRKTPAYYHVPLKLRILYGLLYFGMMGALGYLMNLSFQLSPSLIL